MHKWISAALVLSVLIITSGTTLSIKLRYTRDIECIKNGGSMEIPPGRTFEAICQKK